MCWPFRAARVNCIKDTLKVQSQINGGLSIWIHTGAQKPGHGHLFRPSFFNPPPLNWGRSIVGADLQCFGKWQSQSQSQSQSPVGAACWFQKWAVPKSRPKFLKPNFSFLFLFLYFSFDEIFAKVMVPCKQSMIVLWGMRLRLRLPLPKALQINIYNASSPIVGQWVGDN